MKFYLKMAIQSSFKDKQKFIHNIVGISIGVMLLLLVTMMSMSFKEVLYEQMKISDDKVITIASGDRQDTLSYMMLPVFDDSTLKTVSSQGNITKSTGLKGATVTSVYFKNSENENKKLIKNIIYSSDEVFLELYGASVKEGNFCTNDNEVIIGSSVAETYNISVGDTLDVKQFENDYKLKISGIIDKVDARGYSTTPNMINNIILLNINNQMVKDEKFLSIVAEVSDVTLLETESDSITNLLNEENNMTQELKDVDMDAIVVNNLAILDMIDGYFTYVNMFIAFLFVIISVIVIINFLNIMTITILGRSREIGIMKITGGSDFQISKFYSVECLFVGLVGSVIGVISGILINFVITSLLNWDFKFSILISGLTLIVGIVSPTFAGILAQKKIKKQTISDIFHK